MADNRIYLKCNICGKKLYLGKSFLDGFYYENYDKKTLEEKLNEFYDKHTYCNKSYSDGDFDITYEDRDSLKDEKIADLQKENEVLKQQLAEKDTEIEELKDKLKRTEKAMHEEVMEHLEYYNADQKYLRKQVCDAIREKLKKQIIPTAGSWLSYYDIIETNDLLDQIEQGEQV